MALACLLPLLGAAGASAQQATAPQSVWVEAEVMAPLKGFNYSFTPVEQQARGSWALAGTGVAAEFTQGGESELYSIGARADEAAGVLVGRDIEIPVAGQYTLWVRYADYANKKEKFGVRVRQGGKTSEHIFGRTPVVDELDQLVLFWGWGFAWDGAPMTLEKGPARLELYSTGPTEARRQVDCLCLTTDAAYRPTGRRKPDIPSWWPLRAMRQAGMPDVQPLHTAGATNTVPKSWSIADGPPAFLWNVREHWLSGLKQPATERIEAPYHVEEPLQNEFLAAFKGKQPEVYGHPLSGPTFWMPDYPSAFAPGSPALDWLTRHPQSKFAIVNNWTEPTWPAAGTPGSDHAAVGANLRRFGDRFMGFIQGEVVLHGATFDYAEMEKKVRAAKTRAEVLQAQREVYTAGAIKKVSNYYGAPVGAEEAWSQVLSCLSGTHDSLSHALMDWGERRIGHESTGNYPVVARSLGFMRGAARQFGRGIVDYESANLGDSATTLSRSEGLYPASSRYVIDTNYDIWAGAGVNWILKDLLLFHLAGAEAIFNEEGHDMYWKPGGGVTGDTNPVQLSPRGKLTAVVQRLAQAHPRGTQYTPVAFLLDEAHGYVRMGWYPALYGLDPSWNPALLTPGRHLASIEGWFDTAFYPAPETAGEPITAIRQTYVNGIFGDIFDVIVTTPKRTAIASTYPVLIAAGEVPVSQEWGAALRDAVQGGSTLVVSADQFSGPGVQQLDPPTFGAVREASSFTWTPSGQQVPSNVFRYRALTAGKDRVLATASDGTPICVARKAGKGQIIAVAASLGLGIDGRPVPLLGLLMRHLTQGLVPVKVTGDVQWIVNRLDDGGWLVALFNNRGVIKPQHGVLPTMHEEAQQVTLRVPFGVIKSAEWLTETPVPWQGAGNGATTSITIPAGGVRFVAVYPRP